MHFGQASFTNDAPESLRYRSIIKRACVGIAHARDDVAFTLAIAYRQTSALLCSSGFDGQLGPAVKQVKQLAVDSVYQHSPGFKVSLIAQRRDPCRALSELNQHAPNTPKAFANLSPGLERSDNPGIAIPAVTNPERVSAAHA